MRKIVYYENDVNEIQFFILNPDDSMVYVGYCKVVSDIPLNKDHIAYESHISYNVYTIENSAMYIKDEECPLTLSTFKNVKLFFELIFETELNK